jgi:hypothetical protein
VSLAPGQVRRFEQAELDCVQFTAVPAGARYLVVPQNAVEAVALPLRFELRALAGSAAPVTLPPAAGRAPLRDAASEWEMRLRSHERMLGPVTPASAAELDALGASTDPQIGESRDFNVLKQDNTTRRVSAVVQAITQRAILYVDRDAPSAGLTTADLQLRGAVGYGC